jgi:GeoRSP system SPASM domain protein
VNLKSRFALFIDAGHCIENQRLHAERLSEIVREVRQHHPEPALLWTPKQGQLPLLPELLTFCARWQVGRFKLPNHKISVNSQNSSLPDCNDLEGLAAQLRSQGLPEVVGLQLEVHDLFLWELLQPLTGGQRSEYGGCQAANSLGHISGQAELWPCSSWPEPLGSLLEDDLLDLWQSPQRLKVREEIARTPVGCDGCRDFEICFGGCRGLTRACRDDGLERDLLCRERR